MLRAKQMTHDMTTGTPWKLMVAFSVPMLISSLFQQLYSMVDSAIVGRGVGVEALAAIGSTGSLTYFIIGFLMGMTSGFAILFSQNFGAKDFVALRRSFCGSVRVGGVMCVVFTAASLIFTPQLLQLMNTPPEILEASRTYITVIFAAIPVVLAYDILAAFLRSVGDSKTPLYAMVVSTLVNLALDYLLVIVFPLGVFGAAIATVIAQAVSVVYCYFGVKKTGLLKFEKGDWQPNKRLDGKLFGLGLPLAFQTSVTAIGAIVLQRLVNDLGVLYTAGYTAASRVMYFAEMPGSCLGIAMATYAGQNMGANRIDRIKKGVNQTLPLSAGVNLVLGVVMCLFTRELTSIFANPDQLEAILPITTQMMLVQGLMKWILGPLFIYRNALQGMGDTTTAMLSGFLELGMRIGTAYLLVGSLHFLGICIADVSAWVGAEIMLMIVYYCRMHRLKMEGRITENTPQEAAT